MHAVTGSDLHKAEISALWGCTVLHLGSPVVCGFSLASRKLTNTACSVALAFHGWLTVDDASFSVDLSSENMLGHNANRNSHSYKESLAPLPQPQPIISKFLTLILSFKTIILF